MDWNLIENSRHGMPFSSKVPYKFSRSRLNDLACSPLGDNDSSAATDKDVVLSDLIPHLEFTLELKSDSLTK
ncbi:hypothetical protein OAY03_02720 [Candidatus Thioglobus sp.]|nr:hypothetical protein [Candidatus Thioglobus sp.]